MTEDQLLRIGADGASCGCPLRGCEVHQSPSANTRKAFLDRLRSAGYHVVAEGQVPPWMEQATGYVDEIADEPIYRLRPLTDEAN